ncbi:hypothetical protein BsWGS_10264 [Bradybaena similaris]
MVSMKLYVLLAVAAVVALSSSAVLDPKDNGKVGEKSLANSVTESYPPVPDPNDDDDSDDEDDNNGVIDDIPVKYLNQDEWNSLLDNEDNKDFSDIGMQLLKKEVKSRINETTNEVGNTKPHSRHRRWIGLAARGLLTAGRALFRGAARAPKPTVSGTRVTQSYTKSGGYNSAVRDFNRFKPDNLRPINKNGVTGQTGTIGNHRITVRDYSKQGSPTLEIRSPRQDGTEFVRKFRY